jgi:peptidoglycan hydrolase CwlO-like protein
MEATDEEKGLATEKFLALETEVKDLRQQIVHLTARRDSLMVENNELKKQIKKLEKQIYAMRKQYEVA